MSLHGNILLYGRHILCPLIDCLLLPKEKVVKADWIALHLKGTYMN